jgi:tRNA(His) 5'-end guanylyltransferase
MENKKDSLGDRVKELESLQASACLDETQPICVRIDGKSFHTYTKGLARPYDKRLSDLMVETTNFLVEKTNAKLGYTQSDEISLVYFKTEDKQQNFFGGRIQKLTSVLASMATAKFNKEIVKKIPEKVDSFAFFDCRVWNVPTLKDAAEVFIWRQEDAIKNAVSMAAHAHFSHKSVQGKSSRDKIEMLKEKGIIWEEYPEFFKSGTYSKRHLIEVPIPEEMKSFPANQGKETFVRAEIINLHYPRLSRVEDIENFLFKEDLNLSLNKKNKMKI